VVTFFSASEIGDLFPPLLGDIALAQLKFMQDSDEGLRPSMEMPLLNLPASGLNCSNVFAAPVLCSGVIGADMQRELFVALQLEGAHHFIERLTRGRTGRLEPPPALGATKTAKTLLLNPYQLSTHGRLCCCAPTSSDGIPRTCR
jgi:hypothetical protein